MAASRQRARRGVADARRGASDHRDGAGTALNAHDGVLLLCRSRVGRSTVAAIAAAWEALPQGHREGTSLHPAVEGRAGIRTANGPQYAEKWLCKADLNPSPRSQRGARSDDFSPQTIGVGTKQGLSASFDLPP
jgi:hypothetical protein